MMMESGARAKCYNFDIKQVEVPLFDFGSGNRVEVKTHNWLILRNFINLGFSYMTFVIKDNFNK